MSRLPDIDDPAFFSARGCVMALGVFLTFIGVVAAVYYAINEYTDGLLLVIALLLAAILMQLSTRR